MFSVQKCRERLGFPELGIADRWLNDKIEASFPDEASAKLCALKNSEIPILEDYECLPDKSFWDNFPKRELPESASTRVNVAVFREYVEKTKDSMTKSEAIRADKTLDCLSDGGGAFQKGELPPLVSENSKSAYENGAVLTDTIATWVKKGFVAGPFDTPPMAGFRSNPLAVVVRNGKVRPILNMSGPVGRSFNDNVEEKKLEKLHMGTAKQFGVALRKAGKNAVFSKFDLQDAYKLVPAKKKDFRLQGFRWLGKYFVETQQSFGGKPSPQNFDKLAKTKDLIVCIESKTPRNHVFRALDDSPCVAPAGSGIVERFSAKMVELCGKFNMPLADNCPKAEKAFQLQTRGIVLGVGFDSSDMSWFLTKEKSDKIVERCFAVKLSSHVGLKQIQKLMGSINDLGQMSQTVKFHRRAGNAFLRSFNGNESLVKLVPEKLKAELSVIAKIAESAKFGLPIAEEKCHPGLSARIFYTDAAGASFTVCQGERVYHDNENRGVACIGGEQMSDVWGWSKLVWPYGLITHQLDEKGRAFGSKSTTLEAVGMLLPFLAFPEEVKGRIIIFKIDNMAVLHGWYSGYVKNDESASEVLKSVHYISGFFGTTVHVEHVDRVSNDMAELADELSRKASSSKGRALRALKDAKFRAVEGSLVDWLRNPCGKMDLCSELLKEIKKSSS